MYETSAKTIAEIAAAVCGMRILDARMTRRTRITNSVAGTSASAGRVIGIAAPTSPQTRADRVLGFRIKRVNASRSVTSNQNENVSVRM